MKSIQWDLKSNNLYLNEAIDVAKNRPLWRLILYVWRYTLLVVHVRKKKKMISACRWSCSPLRAPVPSVSPLDDTKVPKLGFSFIA